MRRLRLVVLGALFSAACGPLTFTTEVKGESTIAASSLPLLNVFPAIGNFSNLDFDTNQDFQNEKTTRDHVTSVHVELMQLKILSPADQDFGFLDTVEFYARSGDGETLFAQKSGIADLNLP